MKTPINYREINKASWNSRLEYHLKSEFYDLGGFLKGQSSLNEIELEILGDVAGKSILHLQCHFGQDTISLARLNARCTGVDFSGKAIEAAIGLAEKTKTGVSFICCDIYDLPRHLDDQFDIVFTTYGTIGWLPDLDRWAKIIARYLKPGGHFVFVEFHPVVWMFDDDFIKIKYNYFNTGAIVENETATYADPNAEINNTCISWNHSMSEVVNNLIKNGLQIALLNEYDYSPYNCFKNMCEVHSAHPDKKKYRIGHLDDKIPMVYAIKAIREKKGMD